LDGTDFAFQGFPFTNNLITVPVRVKVNQSGTYTISAYNFNHWDGCVLLKDLVTLTEQDLSQAPYSFTISDTTQAPRFQLTLCSSKQTGLQASETTVPVWFEGNGQQMDILCSFNKPTPFKVTVSNILGQVIYSESYAPELQKRISVALPQHELRILKVEAEGRVFTKKCLGL